jgi:hypothetical protein
LDRPRSKHGPTACDVSTPHPASAIISGIDAEAVREIQGISDRMMEFPD